MRVTNSMLVSSFLNNLNVNTSRLGQLQGQLASNRKYVHISDDPVSVIYSQQARAKLDTLNTYQTNVETGQGWLTQTETSVTELNKLIQSAYEQIVDASTNIKNDSDRQAMAQYMGQLRDQVLTVLNSTYGDKYLFGGHNTTGYVDGGKMVTPFAYEEVVDTDPSNPTGKKRVLTYNGIDVMTTDPAEQAKLKEIMNDTVTLDIGAGIQMEVSMNGVNVMNYTQADGTPQNIYNLMDEITRMLENGVTDPDVNVVEKLNKFIKPLQDGQSHTLSLTAEIGGKDNRLELMHARYEQDELNYTQMKSDAEDADQAELIMNYKMAEAVYNAALATGAYIIQPTLMDFLR